MGSFLDKPKTDKTNASGSGNALNFGVASMQGWRIEMEDAHCSLASVPIPGFEAWSFFAVFDGHAGSKVSQYCSEHILEHILKIENSFLPEVLASKTQNGADEPQRMNGNVNPSSAYQAKIKSAMKKGFLDLDDTIRKLPEFTNGDDKSGSTAVACLISPNNIYLINCGDSRAIVARDNKVFMNTLDHKPTNPEERERIQRAGGSVMIQRVNGSLAVSRALGDFEYKMVDGMGPTDQLVSPEPEIYVEERSDKDEFVVLACDGIWDVMSNDELKDFIRHKMKLTTNLVDISNDVLDACLHKGSRDNMSIVIVTLPGAPKPSQDEMDKEKMLHEKLEARIKELVTSNPTPDFSYVLNTVSTENWENLPPGGGLHAKHGFIEEIYLKLAKKNLVDDFD